MSDYRCKACNTKISANHLRLHLQKSPDSRCRQFLAELDCELLSDDKSSETIQGGTLEEQEGAVVDRAGDYFGDYTEWTEDNGDMVRLMVRFSPEFMFGSFKV